MDDVWQSLRPHWTRVELDRRRRLLEAGAISRQLYVVESGCLRLWYNADGRDVTVQFFTDGMAVSSFESLLKEVPSLFTIEAVVATIVRVVDKDTLLNHWRMSPDFQRALVDLLFGRLADYQKLFLDRIANSAQQRYVELCERAPGLVDRVPQHFIASYLGITPVSLSRIRKRVKADNKR
ncbi:MAG: Crp/Fnr family transcriptional regulator [Phyllobacteriaceae bacterium]|nr:Crp/Fnr family transcriptional regulator [Phyllobacteriaceae bacterium]